MTRLDKIVRLANNAIADGPPPDVGPTAPKGTSSTNAVQGQDPTQKRISPDVTAPTVSAASLIPGMVVSHPDIAGGKPFQVLAHSHRGTHAEIVGKHIANGRGVLTRVPTSTTLTMHSAVGEPNQATVPNQTPNDINPGIPSIPAPSIDGGANGSLPGQQQMSGPALAGYGGFTNRLLRPATEKE